MAVPPTMPLEGLAPVRHAERCVAAMRDAVGDGIDIMVDCHARPSPRMGHLFAAALEQFDLFWFEEPCWPERVDDIAAIQRAVRRRSRRRAPVGAAPFNELLTKGACSDPARHHSLRRADRGAADRRPRRDPPRCARAAQPAQGPVSTAASIELGLATPSYIICEAVTSDVPWRDEVASESHPIDPNGMLARATDGRGSIEIDLDVVAQHPFQPELPQRVFYGTERRRLVARVRAARASGRPRRSGPAGQRREFEILLVRHRVRRSTDPRDRRVELPEAVLADVAATLAP
jgi:galactonate dehydratase